MQIIRNLKNYTIDDGAPISSALKKIETGKRGIVFIVDSSNRILGVMTDGDFRRKITGCSKLELDLPVKDFMNQSFIFATEESDNSVIRDKFKESLGILPVIDNYGKLLYLVVDDKDSIDIDNFEISESSPTFIIAEIGNNHNGDISLAKKLVDLALTSGANCVKFQMRQLDTLYSNSGKQSDFKEDLGSQYTIDQLVKYSLSNDEMLEVFEYSQAQGLIPMCTPWDIESLEILEKFGMKAYKISSADFTNNELIEAISKTGKPVICSTGMSSQSELNSQIRFIQNKIKNVVFLHCNSTYPAPDSDVNMKYLNKLGELCDSIIGYSGHERGWLAPLIAVSLGAKVIEKHFTLNRDFEGNDHKVSLLPDEFKEMVENIRRLEIMLGDGSSRKLTQGERINRDTLAKSIIAKTDITKGVLITRSMLDIKSPGKGLQPNRIDELIGKKANRNISQNDFFYQEDLEEFCELPRKYKFNREFGVPVRYHDIDQFSSSTNLDFVEFHFSYSDIKLNPSDFIKPNLSLGFSVHCPELFEDEHLLNLATEDTIYRNKSIQNLQRVIELSIKLKSFFNDKKKPFIIVNCGGYTLDGFVNEDSRKIFYDNVADSLKKLHSQEVELIIQTMPPFPWHFGGQSHHNIFVSSTEIKKFCKETGFRICLDISHTQMACSYYGWSLNDFIYEVKDHIAYMHISDAEGIDGEGVDFGKGDINFEKLKPIFNEELKEIPFIPEVWQGHKANGSGFWNALNYLERIL